MLRQIGLPNYFIKCFQTLYQDAEASVINNSTTTRYFPVTRSCRQGDPIAPYLFIISIDPLLRRIVNDDGILGIRTPEEEVKLTAYADDICLTVRDGDALKKSLAHIRAFANFSGLNINENKTEVMKIGTPPLIGDILTKEHITVTGVTFGNDKDSTEKLNFDKPLAKMKALLTSWQQRGLSLKGRALVAKTQGLTQMMYLSQTLTIPEWVHKDANSTIYKFVWKGPDKVTRLASRSDDERSIKLTDVRTMNMIHMIQNLSKVEHPARWTQFLRRDRVVINADINKAKKHFKPKDGQLDFITDIIRSCQVIQEEYSTSDVRENSTLANNYIFRDYKLKPLEFPRLGRKGLIRLDQVLQGGLIPRHDQQELTYLEKLEWTKLTRYINPIIQRSSIRLTHSPSETPDMVIMIGEAKICNELLTYQNITATLRKNRNYPFPPAWTKGEHHAQNEQNWLSKKSYRQWGYSARFLDFCHRWLSGLLFARKQLHRFGIKDSPVCQMCGEDPQTVEHLFWYCPEINTIKEVIATSLNVSVQSFNPTMAEFQPHLTARVFHCIYLENIQSITIVPDKVISRFQQYLDLEKVIMEKNGKMILFLKFWGNVHRP
jgi:hypothetical protein